MQASVGYLLEALTPFHVLLALGGVIAGTVVGSLPGLTATMAVAVLVPITFTMEPAAALILMGAIYTGAIYGGAYAAILLNTPGTPSAIATTFDGYPMAKRGDGDLAITLACLASVCGGLVGALFLLSLAPPLANVALAFGPVEYFWLAILGLTLIAALSQGNLLKGLVGACFGLLLSCVGVAEISADVRLTFGSQTLLGGIEVVSALIGLYCIPVLIDLVATPDRHLKVDQDVRRGFRLPEALRISWRGKFNLARSSVIGTLVGILPGAGGSIAGLVAYSEARRAARDNSRFGKGAPEGVQATESANNATVGGGFIPTLVLGIPGTPPDAVILGALLIQGVKTAADRAAHRPLRLPLHRRRAQGDAGAHGSLHDPDRHLCHSQQRVRCRHHDPARRRRLAAGTLRLQRLPHRAGTDPGLHRRAGLRAGLDHRRRHREPHGAVLRPAHRHRYPAVYPGFPVFAVVDAPSAATRRCAWWQLRGGATRAAWWSPPSSSSWVAWRCGTAWTTPTPTRSCSRAPSPPP
jgi:hypothetical protein